jgi:S-adenosylmethionine:tRNA ribosyltransferase-isomerase
VDELDYELPADRIAQTPAERREDARLLVVRRDDSPLVDAHVRYLPRFLHPGDLLVLNDTKVLPARFVGRRSTGGRVEGLFLREPSAGEWVVLLERSRRLKIGERLHLGAVAQRPVGVTLHQRLDGGHWKVLVEPADQAERILDLVGTSPLPHYIHRADHDPREGLDRERYQTVYARVPGAVAAPTAGLHLSQPLLDELRDRGVGIAFVTLHVGEGTFKPVQTERLANHPMHEERFELPAKTVEAIHCCREGGGRVVAVGTTTVRVLETAAEAHEAGGSSGDTRGSVLPTDGTDGMTKLLIMPGFRFRVVDALLTNFHLPRTTLLALVMAFAGAGRIRMAYGHAVASGYRFFSYGDAMLLV